METLKQQPDGQAVPETDPESVPKTTVLVVDDSRVQRRILTAWLNQWGYDVLNAESGEKALQICQETTVDLVLSDWMMPGMNGLEFCTAFRSLDRQRYGYFILLTSKSEKEEVAQGLEVGADDFLTKPVNSGELKARLIAGERILMMERELQDKNRLVSATLEELRVLYDTVDRDLIEAKKLQQSLVSERHRDFGVAQISLLLRPSGHVGGDLVGMFSINDDLIGLYGIDVSGHGITSALMTARLAGYLSGANPSQNIALKPGKNGAFLPRPPAEVVSELNQLVLADLETDHYFTLILGHLDLKSGKVTLCQAGHPFAVLVRQDGGVLNVGSGGLPVGLVEGAEYDEFDIDLSPGDQLLLPSDGITECPLAGGAMLDDHGLRNLMKTHHGKSGETLLNSIVTDLETQSDLTSFPDDVSAVLIDFRG